MYLENLTARDVESSWKKYWGLHVSKLRGQDLEETRQQTGPFVDPVHGERKFTCHPFTVNLENCLTNYIPSYSCFWGRWIRENRKNGNCNNWINCILTQGLDFRSIYSILKSLNFHPDSLPCSHSRAPTVSAEIQQQPVIPQLFLQKCQIMFTSQKTLRCKSIGLSMVP